MKGFIEVNTYDYGTVLINVMHIDEVRNNRIYTSIECIICRDDYDELKAKIEEAME